MLAVKMNTLMASLKFEPAMHTISYQPGLNLVTASISPSQFVLHWLSSGRVMVSERTKKDHQKATLQREKPLYKGQLWVLQNSPVSRSSTVYCTKGL